MTSKDIVREVMKRRLHALTPAAKLQGSAALCQRLQAVPQVRRARRIMAFLNMADEVSVDDFIRQVLGRGDEIYVPLCLGPSRMVPIRLASLAETVRGTYGIRTVPVEKGSRIAPSALDCILVPGLAFDKARHRLGRGGGYYDRFLPQCPQAFTLAVAWDMQLIHSVPVDTHDCQMAAVLTEHHYLTNTSYPKGGSIVADT